MKKGIVAAASVLALSIIAASAAVYAPKELSTETDADWGYDVPLLFGDADGDSLVNICDLVRLKKYLSDTDGSSVRINFSACDYNGDDNINSFDLGAMRRQLLTAKTNWLLENSVGAPDWETVDESSLVTLKAESSSELLKNPGKGWFVYGSGTDKEKPFTENQAAAWDYASIGYIRYRWSDIEPEEGKFDWDYIDNAIKECKKHNARFAFGIMSADPMSTNDYVTPKWVFDAGAEFYYSEVNNSISGTLGVKQYVPNFGDSVYIDKLENLACALASRYGGSPYIEFIDVRCYGSWGENNFYDIKELYKEQDDTGVNAGDMWNCWQTYINAFENTGTRLIVAYSLKNNALKEVFERAIAAGVGLRNDGAFHWNGSNYGTTNLWAAGKTPAVMEFAASYGILKNKGCWDTAKFLETVSATKTSYYPLGGAWETDAEAFITDQKSAVEEMTNKIGYHFTLTEAKVSKTMGCGNENALIMNWTNSGNAPIFIKSHLAAALLDKNGNAVEICWLDGVDMSLIAPQSDVGTVTVKSPLRFYNSPGAGYRLAIGLFTSKNRSEPDIRLGNANRTESGWYVLSEP